MPNQSWIDDCFGSGCHPHLDDVTDPKILPPCLHLPTGPQHCDQPMVHHRVAPVAPHIVQELLRASYCQALHEGYERQA